MFQFARQSAKAVLVAASAAGVAALGAGSAGADDLGALSATDSLPQATPATAGLPAGLGGGAESLVSKVQEADLRTVQPVPSTPNLGTPAGDVSHVAPQAQAQLDSVHNTIARARNTVGLSHGTVHHSAGVPSVPGVGNPAGVLPTGAVDGLLGGVTSTVPLGGAAGSLPLSNEVQHQAGAVEGAASTLPADAGVAGVPAVGNPAGLLPADAVNGALGGAAGSLPLSNEVQHQAGAVEGAASTLPADAGVPDVPAVGDAADTVPTGAVNGVLGGANGKVHQAANGMVPGVGNPANVVPNGAVNGVLGGANGKVHQAANGVVPGVGNPAGLLPTGAVNGLLGGAAGSLPLSNEVQHQAGAVDGTATTLPAYDVAPQQGDPLGMLPTGDLTGLLGEDAFSVVPGATTETLPLSNELPAPTSVQGQPAEIAGEAVGSAVEQTAGTVLPNTTDEVDTLAGELPEPSTESVEDQLPETPVSVEGVDTEAVESTVPATGQVQDAADTVTEEAPSVGEVAEQVDISEAAGDVTEAAAGGAGATGVVDVVEGVGTPAL
ncbi:hypothetical protein GCM10023224_15380 [Streptomonospora halophila]|uniref:Small secreted domain n=1 Tax=Streptomonospora halophila TaxID=427369 RepID=A0ABP9GJ96_9ACTN